MLAQGDRLSFSGEAYLLKSNDPLLLDDPETIWLVQSGSFALFAINVQHGIPKGRRRYLFSVKAGEAMFTALSSVDGQHQILAVTLEEAKVLQISKQVFCELMTEGKAYSHSLLPSQLIERWVNHLGSAVLEMTAPILPTPAKIPGCTVLASKEVFQPSRRTVWVKVLLRWLGTNLRYRANSSRNAFMAASERYRRN